MRYGPAIHHRRSIRLRGYDYSQAGAYFVTVCTRHLELLLERQDVREVVLRAWEALATRFPTVRLDEFVIMPNHVHGVVILWGAASRGGAASRAPTDRPFPTLGEVVLAFKSLSAIAANRVLNRVGLPFWQRNYYEHIVRDEDELNHIRQYIRENPLKWAEDPDNPVNL